LPVRAPEELVELDERMSELGSESRACGGLAGTTRADDDDAHELRRQGAKRVAASGFTNEVRRVIARCGPAEQPRRPEQANDDDCGHHGRDDKEVDDAQEGEPCRRSTRLRRPA
jgi:hypothetical protein